MALPANMYATTDPKTVVVLPELHGDEMYEVLDEKGKRKLCTNSAKAALIAASYMPGSEIKVTDEY